MVEKRGLGRGMAALLGDADEAKVVAGAPASEISGVREAVITRSPPSRFCTAAVAMVVRGHSVFAAMPSPANSAARPSVASVIPYFASV